MSISSPDLAKKERLDILEGMSVCVWGVVGGGRGVLLIFFLLFLFLLFFCYFSKLDLCEGGSFSPTVVSFRATRIGTDTNTSLFV